MTTADRHAEKALCNKTKQKLNIDDYWIARNEQLHWKCVKSTHYGEKGSPIKLSMTDQNEQEPARMVDDLIKIYAVQSNWQDER